MRLNDTPAFRARFWAKVDTRGGLFGCWLWTGAKNNKGYGQIGAGGYGTSALYAHRVSWVLHNGPIPDATPCVLHRCDTPLCVNPAHLFLGTVQDNSDDMVSKGRGRNRPRYGDQHHARLHPERMARGERVGGARLTVTAVLTIRAELAGGVTGKELARRYGVSESAIGAIKNGRTWRHL